MVDPKELECSKLNSHLTPQMDFSAALNVYRNLCATTNNAANNNVSGQENPYLNSPLPLFSFPLLLQQLASGGTTPISNPQLMSPTTIQPSQPTPTNSTLKTASSFDSNNGATTSKFHGRHSIWRHFRVMRDENVYRCQVNECAATYTWPPSTTGKLIFEFVGKVPENILRCF